MVKTQECALNPQQHPFEAGSLFVPVPEDQLVAHLTAGDPAATERPVVFQVRPVTYNSPLLVKRPRPVMRTRTGTAARTVPKLRSGNGSKTRGKQNTVPKMRVRTGTGSKSGLGSRTVPKLRSKNGSKTKAKHNTVPKIRVRTVPKLRSRIGAKHNTKPKMRVRPGTGIKSGSGSRTVPKLRSGIGLRDGAKLPLHVPIPKGQIVAHLEASDHKSSMKHSSGVGSKSGLWPRTLPKMRPGTGSKAGAKGPTVPVMRTSERAGSKSGSKSRPVPTMRLWNGSVGPKKAVENPRPKVVDEIGPPEAYRLRLPMNSLSNNLKQWANIQGLTRNRNRAVYLDLS